MARSAKENTHINGARIITTKGQRRLRTRLNLRAVQVYYYFLVGAKKKSKNHTYFLGIA